MTTRLAVSLIGLLIVCGSTHAWSADQPGKSPPVGQNLVREDDFAMYLHETLGLGIADHEAAAKSGLAAVGIVARNGWIADYPVTPDLLTDLRRSILEAVDAGKLSMTKEEAMMAYDDLLAYLGLPVGEVHGYTPAGSAEGYTLDAEQVQGYYSETGPPVITYYSPPLAYGHLYSWVPCAFWYAGFPFHGYYILNDFDRVIVVARHSRRDHRYGGHLVNHRWRDRDGDSRRVTNRVRDRATGRVGWVRPVVNEHGRFQRTVSAGRVDNDSARSHARAGPGRTMPPTAGVHGTEGSASPRTFASPGERGRVERPLRRQAPGSIAVGTPREQTPRVGGVSSEPAVQPAMRSPRTSSGSDRSLVRSAPPQTGNRTGFRSGFPGARGGASWSRGSSSANGSFRHSTGRSSGSGFRSSGGSLRSGGFSGGGGARGGGGCRGRC